VVDCSHALEEKKDEEQAKKVPPQEVGRQETIKQKKIVESNYGPQAENTSAPRSTVGVPFLREGAAAARQSGDLDGLSRAEQADSESVGELVEEGNIFEAGAVAGVEEADDQDSREVHTHEVTEDDVPAEYLDKD
jgi:hypothetical protein